MQFTIWIFDVMILNELIYPSLFHALSAPFHYSPNMISCAKILLESNICFFYFFFRCISNFGQTAYGMPYKYDIHEK